MVIYIPEKDRCLIYASNGEEADLVVSRGIAGPGVMIGVTPTENGYRFVIHSMEPGPCPGCRSKLEINCDLEIKELAISKDNKKIF